MNKDIFGGKWDQVKGNLQSKWGKLTDDDLEKIKGDSKVLHGKLQEYYGLGKEEIENELNNLKDFFNK